MRRVGESVLTADVSSADVIWHSMSTLSHANEDEGL